MPILPSDFMTNKEVSVVVPTVKRVSVPPEALRIEPVPWTARVSPNHVPGVVVPMPRLPLLSMYSLEASALSVILSKGPAPANLKLR